MKKILIVCLIMLCSATSLYAQQFFTVDPLQVFTVEELDGYGYLQPLLLLNTMEVLLNNALFYNIHYLVLK